MGIPGSLTAAEGFSAQEETAFAVAEAVEGLLPVVGPNPGNTPNIRPANVPKKSTRKSSKLNNGANIYIKFSIYYL